MQPLQTAKTHVFVAPQLADAATYTSTVCDTAGADYLEVNVALGFTDVAMTTLKLQESDAITNSTTLDGGTDITGYVFGTSTNPDTNTTSALPSATDDNRVFQFRVPLQGRKRYINLLAVAGNGTTGTFLAAHGKLGKLEQDPVTASEAGLGAWL